MEFSLRKDHEPAIGIIECGEFHVSIVYAKIVSSPALLRMIESVAMSSLIIVSAPVLAGLAAAAAGASMTSVNVCVALGLSLIHI